MIDSKTAAFFSPNDAMYPKVAIEPKSIMEADLGPVIGEDEQDDPIKKYGGSRTYTQDEIDRLNCEPGEIRFVPKGTDPRDFKPSNPKDAIAVTKLPLDLVPSVGALYESLAFYEGALKYGKYNWRVGGASFAVYLGALLRHTFKLLDGEWADKKTRVPHLSSVRACCGIILDAYEIGNLVDDRPPVVPTSTTVEKLEAIMPHLKELFQDYHPHQHTIMDAKEPE